MLFVVLAAVMGGEARAVVVMGRVVMSERVGKEEKAVESMRVESERAFLGAGEVTGFVDGGPLVCWFPGGFAVARSDCGAGQDGARPSEEVGLSDRVLTAEAGAPQESGTAVMDPASWRAYSLRLTRADGTVTRVGVDRSRGSGGWRGAGGMARGTSGRAGESARGRHGNMESRSGERARVPCRSCRDPGAQHLPDAEGIVRGGAGAATTTGQHSAILRKNLDADGRTVLPNEDAAHIVASGHPLHAEARGILDRAGIGFDDAINGGGLQSNTRVPNPLGKTTHNQTKTHSSMNKVTRELRQAEQVGTVHDTLRDIEIRRQSGSF